MLYAHQPPRNSNARANPMPMPARADAEQHNQPRAPLRFITAAGLFDGHDAAINIVRRILQSLGVEVIHLGHNRSVDEVVTAALDEDAHGIALSSYQGGHVEYLKYMVDQLRQRGGAHIRIFAGGGGVIVADEIRELEAYGVTRIYSPEHGRQLGLVGMIEDTIAACRPHTDAPPTDVLIDAVARGERRALAQLISALQPDEVAHGESRGVSHDASHDEMPDALHDAITERLAAQQLSSTTATTTATLPQRAPALGITGTGGAGKSSLTDELILRFRIGRRDELKIALLAIDPTRRKSGGALLGDRIRMNAIAHPNIFMRSVATRGAHGELPRALDAMIAACRLARFDLIIVETPGIGQGESGIIAATDCALYVMTPEYGAQSQLEKIDMLDFAAFTAINKFDRKGADDAYRDVCKQMQRNRQAFDQPLESMPVYGTIASQFNDDGITALYQGIVAQLESLGLPRAVDELPPTTTRCSTTAHRILPANRARYLAEIAECVRDYKSETRQQAESARQRQQLDAVRAMLRDEQTTRATDSHRDDSLRNDSLGNDSLRNDSLQDNTLDQLRAARDAKLTDESKTLLDEWPGLFERYQREQLDFEVRGQTLRTDLTVTTLSGLTMRKIALPAFHDHGDLLNWLRLENLPGRFPFTAGVFAFKRENESPTRMFAGEGDAARTNRRFKQLSKHTSAKRLSTAFDSVTLYGCDPAERPDIYGKIGNAGVSIATLDDMKTLYDGFDLCDPRTSVSMTINGPAPIVMAMFLNTAIAQRIDAFCKQHNRDPDSTESKAIEDDALRQVRGTVQADILKEDQGQNTCIFSIEFSLKLMGDIQQYFIAREVRNFYSVSISGYHIAEAGANPVTQLAFTLANGFTYVESYLARGMNIDDFAGNLSFFFSNGMDPEYSVLGRVARRIWAVAMRNKYGADTRAQKLKYHIQTSGRSLHAQEMDFNDIRTTLQALIAVYDNCNSLHTNAYDEAVTTPTEESVRRALAIQLIINNEWGLAFNHNPNQGSFIIEQLTDLVEEAVLDEFERLSARGGVLGAMETGYQRGKIQDESMHYEQQKHDGSLPIIGVNTFENPSAHPPPPLELARSSESEKQNQLRRLQDFQTRHADQSAAALARVKQSALSGENVFAALVDAVQYCSLGQLTELLYEVGGRYRRNM